ncbi:hypothetical protein J6590_034392 [Homalodisca vitripennis]|nr:hypothetical protein J6590_034392 [Homalodisca vitripennis]
MKPDCTLPRNTIITTLPPQPEDRTATNTRLPIDPQPNTDCRSQLPYNTQGTRPMATDAFIYCAWSLVYFRYSALISGQIPATPLHTIGPTSPCLLGNVSSKPESSSGNGAGQGHLMTAYVSSGFAS